MYHLETNQWIVSDEMERLKREKFTASELQMRKHEDWNDNYELYRNKVKTNRLTQRQAVNIPLMKETIKTLLSKIDDAPNVDWKELGGDQQKELIYQEIWNNKFKENKLELIDILDKKNVLLYGFSVKKLNLIDDGISVSVLDPYDILLDPLSSSWDFGTNRFIIHQNIFKNIRDILADDKYTKEGKEELKIWAESPAGITQDSKSREEWEKKMERLKIMGVDQGDFPYFAGGDRIVNLTEHYTKIWNKKEMKFERRVIVYADDTIELLNERLEDLIGVDFWPFVMWSEDPETTDTYPDSVADLVRTPNKVLNVWFSQLIENRTLKNFQMHWYSPSQGYTPQTYIPGPGVMLPAPPGEDISKVIRPVEISGLDDTLTAIQTVIQIVERGTGATAIEKGQGQEGQQTLGEVEILVGKATERVTAMAKFYRMSWYELCWKWDKMMQANAPKFIKLFKVSQSGKLYPKTVFRNDWVSDIGYEPIVSSSSEQEAESIKTLQKFDYIIQKFPGNQALVQIAQRRMLDSVDVTPEEMKMIEEGQKKADEQMAMQVGGQSPAGQAPNPLMDKMAQLGAM